MPRTHGGGGGPPQPGPPQPGPRQPGPRPSQPRSPCQPPPCPQPVSCTCWAAPGTASGPGAAFAAPASPTAERPRTPAIALVPRIFFRVMSDPPFHVELLTGTFVVLMQGRR